MSTTNTTEHESIKQEIEAIQEKNALLLKQFGEWLKKSGLSPKTIKSHVHNVDFYINEYLVYYEATPAHEGIDSVNMFLGYWFIKKAMWSSPASIKQNAASIKKFYTLLMEQGQVTPEELKKLTDTIKENMPEWIETMERYSDPDIEDMNEVWGMEDF
jgi:site-specific recombinase XerD